VTRADHTVYVGDSNQYHASRYCAGSDADETTLADAEADERTPCGTCAVGLVTGDSKVYAYEEVEER
jgi:hypothetical protein